MLREDQVAEPRRIQTIVRPSWIRLERAILAGGYLGATVREDDRLDNDREVGELPPLSRTGATRGRIRPRARAQKRPTMREIEWHDVNVTRQISLGMVAVRFLSRSSFHPSLAPLPLLPSSSSAGMSGTHASRVIRKSGYHMKQRRIATGSSADVT